MTLIGAINDYNKKIIFADKKWKDKSEEIDSKIFLDSKYNNLIAVSGTILNNFIRSFGDGNYKSIESLIYEFYSDLNVQGTSFISYNFENDCLTGYLIYENKILLSKIDDYVFFGYNVNEFEFSKDILKDSSLYSIITNHQKKYSEYISSDFEFVTIHSSGMTIYNNINLL
jgi:hypothetical protein